MPEMGLTNGADDSVSTLGGSEQSQDVSPELIDHINSVLSPSEAEPAEASEPLPAPVDSARKVAEKVSVDRQVKLNQKQQQDTILEEGLEDEDGNAPAVDQPSEDEQNLAGDGQEEAEVETGQMTPTDDAPPLDPNLRFVAQFYGWTDERIDKLYAADPELAAGTFEQLLGAFQAMSRQQGVLPPQQRTQQAPQQTALQPAPQVSQLEQLFANPKAFADANGEQLGQLLTGIQREVYQPLKTALQQVAQIQAEYMVQKQQAVAAEATNATAGLSQKFPDVYGTDSTKLNLFQQQARQNLFTVADQLRAGAYQQGKEMTVSDAINRAHLIVTAGKQQQAARQQVRNQVQQRSRKVTARPTNRNNPRGAGVAKGDEAAIEAFTTRAAELGLELIG